ncbi:hypothetical protein B7463_g11838, partial [Scytalidium lignicola]
MADSSTTQEPIKLSLGESLDFALKISHALAVTLVSLVTYPFTSASKKHPLLSKHLISALARSVSTSATIRQIRANGATTEAIYNTLATKNNFTPNTITIDDNGTKAHWIGDSSAKKVLLFFHSGGYCFHGSPEELTFCWDQVKATSGKMAVLALDYDLAPKYTYPCQLAQAAKALQYLLSNGKSPSDIIISGPSAGGHLCLSLLSHLSHPHPNPIVPAITLSSPLEGCLLISPGVSLDGQDPPLSASTIDGITPEGTAKWGAAYRGGAELDPYNAPVTADADWWKGFKADKVLIVAGAEETLAGNIKELSRKIKGEGHVAVFLDAMMGYERPQSAIIIDAWIQKTVVN